MINVLEKIHLARAYDNIIASEIIDMMKRMEASTEGESSMNSSARLSHDLVQDMKESRLFIKQSMTELASMKKKK